MSSVPLAVKLLLAAILIASIAGAFFGPPPQRKRPGALRWLAGLGAVLYAAAGVSLWGAGSVLAGALFVCAGVEVVCLAAWLARARGNDRRWPPEEDLDPDDPEPPGEDWAAFETALHRWQGDRPRSPLAG